MASNVGQTGEDALAVVVHERGLAVHHLGRPHHLAAEHLAHALVAEAHAEDRPHAGEAADHLVGQAGVVGGARAGRHEHAIGLEREYLLDGELVGPVDQGLGAELAQVLHQVEHERVVVVDDQHPSAHGASTVAVAPDAPRSGSLSQRLSATRRVLAIEDDPDIAEFLRAYFRASGYDFVHEDPVDADDGLAAIVDHAPDCVLLDIGLRGFSGLEIYRRARGLSSLALTPVVVVTADGTVRERTDATAAGIDGFVAKPFNVNTLAGVVAQRIEAARALGDSGVVEEGSEVLTTAVLDARLADEIEVARRSGAPLTFGIVSLRSPKPGRGDDDSVRAWLVRTLVQEASPRIAPDVALARTSTDELALVAPGSTCTEVTRWLEPLLGELRGLRALPGGDEVVVELIAGLAGFPDHALEPDGLYMAADAALAGAADARRLVAVAL